MNYILTCTIKSWFAVACESRRYFIKASTAMLTGTTFTIIDINRTVGACNRNSNKQIQGNDLIPIKIY